MSTQNDHGQGSGPGNGNGGPPQTPPGQIPCFAPGTRIAVPLETVEAVVARMRARDSLSPAEAMRLRGYEAQLRTASR